MTNNIPTTAERIDNVLGFGYTVREASFLVTAALHAGYFLMRQMAPNGGTVATRFHKRVLAFRHAKTTTVACNARLYHLCGKSLYRALDQENNRHRRAHNPFHVRAKLIGLDYVIDHPAYQFLPTEQEKVAFFDGLNIPRSLFPTRTYTGKEGETDRYFIEKYPVRIDPATRQVAFCFVDDGTYSELSFDTWLINHTKIIQAIPWRAGDLRFRQSRAVPARSENLRAAVLVCLTPCSIRGKS